MKVKATKKGFDGTCVREPGDVFEMPDGSEGSWFDPVKEPRPEPEKKPAKDDKSLA